MNDYQTFLESKRKTHEDSGFECNLEESRLKEWIDQKSYEELLIVWRTAPLGNPLFIERRNHNLLGASQLMTYYELDMSYGGL